MPGEAKHPWRRTLGAVPLEEGLVEFRVWAPKVSSVAVRLHHGDHELAAAGEGVFEGRVGAEHGDDYVFVLDREPHPDPCSRLQPDGVRGCSRVVDTRRFEIADGPGVRVEELVLYELHIGTFSQEGTFDGAVPRLRGLRELGITAVEVMPIAAFPGNRNWGYDGLYTFAPHPAYGGPGGFARFVDAAHREGLAVFLDVVYNHVGPGGEALEAFGPYFTDRHDTFWGDAIDYSQGGVREWAIQNALLWTCEYKVDGLRLDAVQAIFDDSQPHVLRELKQRVGDALVTSEMELGDWRPIEEWGHDAQWFDATHHELHVLLTGEREGYYAGHGSVEALACDLQGRGKPPERLIVCSQNHDQVGNRARGDRLPPEALRVAAAVTLSPPARRCSSWARSTRSRTRFSSSQTTSTRSSPTPRVRGARRSSRRSPRSPARTCPTRRRWRRSSARSSRGSPTRRRVRSTRGCCGCGGNCRGSSRRVWRAGLCVCGAAASSSSPTSTRRRWRSTDA